jgi:hypothetical protein
MPVLCSAVALDRSDALELLMRAKVGAVAAMHARLNRRCGGAQADLDIRTSDGSVMRSVRVATNG